MAGQTIGNASDNYQPPQTKNIAELESVSVDLVLLDGKGKDKDNKEFSYKYIEVDGEEYRVPGKVLGDLKEIRKLRPNLKRFKVNKKGTGLGTQYTVIQLD